MVEWQSKKCRTHWCKEKNRIFASCWTRRTLFLIYLNSLWHFLLCSTTATTEVFDNAKMLMWPKQNHQEKCVIMESVIIYILSSNKYSIMSFSSHPNDYLLSCSSGATTNWITLSLRKKYEKKYHFLRKRKFVKSVCNWVCFTIHSHNPLKQGSHYVNSFTVDPCSWIYSTGPEMLQHGATDQCHEKNIWTYLNCCSPALMTI